MTQLYPLLMSPAFDPRPWGTLDLSAIYPNHKFNERIGEAWLTGDNCVVTNGPLAKRSLADSEQGIRCRAWWAQRRATRSAFRCC